MAAHLAPYRYAPGDNGGTHRGPDHFPRKRVVQAIVMGALADEGFVPIRDRETGKRLYRLGGDEAVRPSRFALVELIRERLKRIARRGSDRDVLTMVRDMHQILQDPKGEAAEAVEPRRVTFVAEPAALQERQAAEPIKGAGRARSGCRTGRSTSRAELDDKRKHRRESGCFRRIWNGVKE